CRDPLPPVLYTLSLHDALPISLRRVVLVVPPAQCVRFAALGVAAGEGASRAPRQGTVDAAQRQPQRLAHDRRALRRPHRGVRLAGGTLADRLGDPRLRPAGGGQLPRALRPAAAEDLVRSLPALPPRALVELRPPGHQHLPVPPAAPLGPPRQPDAPLPGPAQLRGGPAAPVRLRRHDRCRLLPAAVAQG